MYPYGFGCNVCTSTLLLRRRIYRRNHTAPPLAAPCAPSSQEQSKIQILHVSRRINTASTAFTNHTSFASGAISANVAWRLPEVNIGIVCANAPVFRPLYLYFQGRLASQQSLSETAGSRRRILPQKGSWQNGSWVSTFRRL